MIQSKFPKGYASFWGFTGYLLVFRFIYLCIDVWKIGNCGRKFFVE